MVQEKKRVGRRAAAGEPGGAARIGSAEGPLPRSYYDGWFEKIVQRLEHELRERGSLENLELGPELEIAICHALRRLLPERVEVCRGWVVDKTGTTAGDDIIVYDSSRFPTLRGLGREVARKERVPAEAVLAYIEVKSTLYAQSRVDRKNKGQSLEKACNQIAAVKSLQRDRVPLNMIAPRFALPEGEVQRRKGFPVIRNPWYAAIWALKLQVDGALAKDPAEAVACRLEEIKSSMIDPEHLPDVIAADRVLMTPALDLRGSTREARPFLTDETNLVLTNGVPALGVAIMHLSWAIEDILLGELPWRHLIHRQLAPAEQRHGSSTIEASRTRRRRHRAAPG